MSNLLSTGAAWLAGQLGQHASTACILRREDDRTIEFDAIPGMTQWEGESYEGASFRFETRDFIVQTSLLLLDGLPYRPDAGDEIDVAAMGVIFQVFAPTDAGCWRYSDPAEQSIRIHTKRTDRVLS